MVEYKTRKKNLTSTFVGDHDRNNPSYRCQCFTKSYYKKYEKYKKNVLHFFMKKKKLLIRPIEHENYFRSTVWFIKRWFWTEALKVETYDSF